MKTLLLSTFFLLNFSLGFAQTKPAMPDVNKMMKMSPAELEAYKKQMQKQYSAQAKEIAQQAN